MENKQAKELLHIRDWLAHAALIVERGHTAYEADPLLQEAGDAIMMKLGEAANRLTRLGLEPPRGIRWLDAVDNRNWLIHQYDEVDRDQTWETLRLDLAAWLVALDPLFSAAESHFAGDT